MLRQELFGDLNRRQKEYADGIYDTSVQMTGVVADIFDLATIEAGRMDLDVDTIDPHAMLVGAVNMVRDAAARKSIDLKFDCPPDIGWIRADERRLKQVAFNLLNNAVYFTPRLGTVRLKAERIGQSIELSVSDNGPGIPKGERDKVLEPFERAKSHRRSAGAGLGLTIVQRFVQLHGGDVVVKSNAERGTTVVCRLPIQPEQPLLDSDGD